MEAVGVHISQLKFIRSDADADSIVQLLGVEPDFECGLFSELDFVGVVVPCTGE